MTTQTEALKSAIEFAEFCLEELDLSYMASNQAKRLIEKSKEALAQQEQGEPVGYVNHGTAYHTKGRTIYHAKPSTNLEKRWWTDDIPVYARSQQNQDEVERLTDALKKANAQAEHFEREWYLRGDELEKLKQEQGEPDELKHIAEHDCLLDVDEKAWKALVENRGGCRCFLSPPCGACSNPISEEEMNEVGYTYTTPQQPSTVVRKPLTDEEILNEYCATPNIHQFISAFKAGVRFAEAAHGIKE
jgi:hypothetical protein